jgi:hypothetical protein
MDMFNVSYILICRQEVYLYHLPNHDHGLVQNAWNFLAVQLHSALIVVTFSNLSHAPIVDYLTKESLQDSIRAIKSSSALGTAG